MKRCMNCMKKYGDKYEVCPYCGYIEGTEPKEAYHLKPGTILRKRFQIGTVVGYGGFGVVYRAWDMTLDKMVAVKEFYPVGLINRVPGESKVIVFLNKRREFAAQLDRFLEEARNMAKFSSHPNIVNVYNFFEENNTAYIVMEFLDGITYKTYLKNQKGVIQPEDAIEIILSVLAALEEIHKSHIIHRDVAPDNIFICKDGRIKLMDFGAARFLNGEEESAHTIILKPGFAPPEQYQAKSKQGTFTDIYAVGALLYWSLTGVMPEESTNRCTQDDLKEPKELNPEISDALNNAIMRAMALNSNLRFQTDEEFMQALKIKGKGKIRSVKGELKYRKRKRLLGAGIAACILAVGGFGGYRIYEERKAQIELRPADVTMWVCIPDGEQADHYSDIYYTALAEYTEKYPQISLTIEAIAESEYTDRLKQAESAGQLPDIYQAVDEEGTAYGRKVNRVWKYIDQAEYTGIDGYDNTYPEQNVCPVTYEMPAVYINTTYEDVDDTQIANSYQENMADGRYDISDEDVDNFLAGETAYLLADTSVYQNVQSRLAGIYQMRVLESENAPASYELRFCISKKAGIDQYNAGIQLLYYLLSENAQSALCMGNHMGIPMQNDIYERYVALNPEYEVFDDIRKNLSFQR